MNNLINRGIYEPGSKELLLRDFCARLPYGVKVNISASRPDRYDSFVKSINDATIDSIDLNIEKCKFKEFWWDSYIVNVRPYLRPMSSMTEEERKEYKHLVAFSGSPNGAANFVDWLNKNMFAYRTIDGKDMFELGLAIEAPEGMYEC